MLFRQDFGGRHHGSLKTACVFQRNQRRQRGNNGFATAHVALQQAVHGVRLG